jgi:hypothetical protein
MKKILFILIISNLLSAQLPTDSLTPPLITFFVRPEQDLQKKLDADQLMKKSEKLGALDRLILKAQLAPAVTHGMYFLYAGMVARSDSNGQVIFPRKHAQDTIDLVITRTIRPVFLRGNIIHHFVISEKGDAQRYKLTRSSSQIPPLWHIEKEEISPSTRISPLALIVFAKPDHVVIPLVDTVTTAGPNLVLPYIYVSPTATNSLNALNFIKVSKYFMPVKASYRFMPDRYGTIVNP